MRGTAIIKKLRNAVTDHIDEGSKRSALLGTRIGILLSIFVPLMIGGAAAQVCSTGAGQMMGQTVTAAQMMGAMVLGASIVIGAALKALPFRLTDKAANLAIVGVFSGLVFLVFGYSALNMVDGYVPFSLTQSCGGGTSSASQSLIFLVVTTVEATDLR